MIQNPIEIETGKKLTKQDRRNMKNDITYEEQDDKLPGVGGGTLKISIYVGSADFFGDQNFEFPYSLLATHTPPPPQGGFSTL